MDICKIKENSSEWRDFTSKFYNVSVNDAKMRSSDRDLSCLRTRALLVIIMNNNIPVKQNLTWLYTTVTGQYRVINRR